VTSKTHLLFPTVVQTTDIENADVLNQRLVKAVSTLQTQVPNTKPDDWACSVYTTLHSEIDLLEIHPFSEMKTIVLREISRYADAMHMHAPAANLRILDAWINVYETGDSQEMHIHKNSVFSGIYYVQAPEGCSEVMFRSSEADTMIDPPKTATDDLNATEALFPAIAGQMIIFRSNLQHCVLSNKTEAPRVSLSFNVDIHE
tara:strand:- start:1015 stop:1620 length:606 start_codon:yes stop_codon:yes gene_type:complete